MKQVALPSSGEQSAFITNLKNSLKTTLPATVDLSYDATGSAALTKEFLANFLDEPTVYPTPAESENAKAWTNTEGIVTRSDATSSAPPVELARGTASVDYVLNADYTMDVTFTLT